MAKRTLVELPEGMRNSTLLNWHVAWQEGVEQLYRGLVSGDKVTDLRVKARDDGSWIAIAKGFGDDGTPIVCFGSGYDTLSALQGLEGAIRANKWKVDKPWQPNGKGE